ncbi:hypothetical protein EUGRSUZ_E03250 [Eucalyptus grandis]|uniref:Uncharacterized protein n=2 Tax=Eucalyptus grandis TaxID=71139 RepID=A0A059C7V6_EUCGR|nr:hypothetical protein EUGRSUZ_E03250 [Eucalyptus grandis]
MDVEHLRLRPYHTFISERSTTRPTLMRINSWEFLLFLATFWKNINFHEKVRHSAQAALHCAFAIFDMNIHEGRWKKER